MIMDELLQYVKKKPSLLKVIKLRPSEKKTLLLCDLNAVVSWLLFPSSSESVWSILDFSRFSHRMTRFLSAVHDIGAEPVFFCDSMTSCSDQDTFINTSLIRLSSQYRESIEPGASAVSTYTSKYSLYTLNPLLYTQTVLYLASKNFRVVNVLQNLLSELVVFADAAACNYDTVLVLSCDIEFAIFPDIQLVLMDFFDLERDIDFTSDKSTIEIVCGSITAAAICTEFGLASSSLVDFAILLGNSFSKCVNKKHQLKVYLRLCSIESYEALLKKYDSPVFNYCPELSYFCSLNKEYDSIISQSYTLYNNPEELLSSNASKNSDFCQWTIDKVCTGHFPIYYYAIVKFGLYLRIPFYQDLSINCSKIHNETLVLRKILYYFLIETDEHVREYSIDSCKRLSMEEVPVTRQAQTCPTSPLIGLDSLPISSKYALMAMLLMTSPHVEMNTKHLNTLITLSEEADDYPLYSISSLVPAIALSLFSKCSSFDKETINVIFCSVFLHTINAKYTLTCDHFLKDPIARNIQSINSFSYILQLVYDLATLVGLHPLHMPLPEFVYNPSKSLKLLEMRTASLYCDKCKEVFTRLVTDSMNCPTVKLFHLKSCDPTVYVTAHSVSEFIQLFTESVTKVDSHVQSVLQYLQPSTPSSVDGSSTCVEESESSVSDEPSTVCLSFTMFEGQDISEQYDTDDLAVEDLLELNTKGRDNVIIPSSSVVIPSSLSPSPTPIMTVEEMRQLTEAPDNKELSILKHRDNILELIQTHRVVCIEGETGCGKSTMVPQFILDAVSECRVIICQPRRVGVVSLAGHVASTRSRDIVGYCAGGINTVCESTQITYSTAGHFLQVLTNRPESVHRYTHIILDEIHDRTITYDFVSLLLRKLLLEGLNCKLILMSATMQSSLFLNYFEDAFGVESVSRPLYVGQGCYPVEEYFIDQLSERAVQNHFDHFHYSQEVAMDNLSVLSVGKIDTAFNSSLAKVPRIVILAQEFCTELIICQAVKGMTTLVFLPGLNEILDYFDFLMNELQGRKIDEYFSVFILHSQIPIEEQEEALKTPPTDKAHVILATNVAESSLTISMLYVVLNFGLQKSTKYDYKRRMTCLTKGWCSKAACTQRKGRVGRLLPGKIYHLFPKRFYDGVLPDYDTAEMCSHSLAKTILQARVIGEAIGISTPSKVLKLAIQPPSVLDMDAAVQELVKVGALMPLENGEASETGRISLLGEFSIKFPLDIDLCRLILYGVFFGCSIEAIVMAAGLSLKQDCLTMPSRVVIKDQQQYLNSLYKSIESRFSFDRGHVSDPILYVHLFWEWVLFCRKNSGKKSTKMKVVNQFSKKYAINNQRFLQLLSSVSYFAGKVKALVPPDHSMYEQLSLLVKINDLHAFSDEIDEAAMSQLWVCVNVNQLRALLAATFMHNLLFGVRKTESLNEPERIEAQQGLVHLSNVGFCEDRSLLVKQYGNSGRQSVIELLNTILPNTTKKVEVFNKLAIVEFPCLPETMKNISLLWQFGERRFKWCVKDTNVMFGKPFHPYEVTWFRWSPEAEKIDLLTWRNRTGLLCDFNTEHPTSCVAVASAIEGSELQLSRIKAKNLTILPSVRKSKLSILVLMAFLCYSSTVMFSVDHVSSSILSVIADSRELAFGLWQKVTAVDLEIVNALRANMSSLLYHSCRHQLPMSDFNHTQEILCALLELSKSPGDNINNILISEVINGSTPSRATRPYYPAYSCSILDNLPPTTTPDESMIGEDDYSDTGNGIQDDDSVSISGLEPTRSPVQELPHHNEEELFVDDNPQPIDTAHDDSSSNVLSPVHDDSTSDVLPLAHDDSTSDVLPNTEPVMIIESVVTTSTAILSCPPSTNITVATTSTAILSCNSSTTVPTGLLPTPVSLCSPLFPTPPTTTTTVSSDSTIQYCTTSTGTLQTCTVTATASTSIVINPKIACTTTTASVLNSAAMLKSKDIHVHVVSPPPGLTPLWLESSKNPVHWNNSPTHVHHHVSNNSVSPRVPPMPPPLPWIPSSPGRTPLAHTPGTLKPSHEAPLSQRSPLPWKHVPPSPWQPLSHVPPSPWQPLSHVSPSPRQPLSSPPQPLSNIISSPRQPLTHLPSPRQPLTHTPSPRQPLLQVPLPHIPSPWQPLPHVSLARQPLSHSSPSLRQPLSQIPPSPWQPLSHTTPSPRQQLSCIPSLPRQPLSHVPPSPRQPLSHIPPSPRQPLSHIPPSPRQPLSHIPLPRQPLSPSTPRQPLSLIKSSSKLSANAKPFIPSLPLSPVCVSSSSMCIQSSPSSYNTYTSVTSPPSTTSLSVSIHDQKESSPPTQLMIPSTPPTSVSQSKDPSFTGDGLLPLPTYLWLPIHKPQNHSIWTSAEGGEGRGQKQCEHDVEEDQPHTIDCELNGSEMIENKSIIPSDNEEYENKNHDTNGCGNHDNDNTTDNTDNTVSNGLLFNDLSESSKEDPVSWNLVKEVDSSDDGVVFTDCGIIGTPGDEVQMTEIERKIVKHIFYNGRMILYSRLLQNNEIRVLEFVGDENLSIEFFLKRRDWFKVAEILSNDESRDTDYVISLVNLQAKFPR